MSEPVRTLPGARWRCCSTSACCRVHQLGPVADEVVLDLRARGVDKDWAPAAEGWVDQRPGPGGTSGWFLRHRSDGACVFLRPDHLCAIHALYGEEAKPAFCREFPFSLSRDSRGLVAVVRPACAGLHEAMLDGEPVQAQAEAAAALPRHAPISTFAPERVEVLPGVHLGLEAWLDAEPSLVALVAAEAQPEEAVARLRRDLARRLGVVLPVPRPERYTLAATAVLEALRMMLGHVLRQSEGAPPYQVDFVRQVHDAVVAGRAGVALGAALDEGALAYARVLLQTELHGRLWQAQGSIPAGLGLWLASVALVRGVHSGQGPVSAAAFAEAHTPFVRLSAHPAVASVLRKARPALVDLFLHACAECAIG